MNVRCLKDFNELQTELDLVQWLGYAILTEMSLFNS